MSIWIKRGTLLFAYNLLYAIRSFWSKVDNEFVFIGTLSNVFNNTDLMQQIKVSLQVRSLLNKVPQVPRELKCSIAWVPKCPLSVQVSKCPLSAQLPQVLEWPSAQVSCVLECPRTKAHKQPPRGVLGKMCSENMQQIYRRTPMPICDFNKVAKQLYWNLTSAWCFPVNLLHIFRTPFSTNTSG